MRWSEFRRAATRLTRSARLNTRSNWARRRLPFRCSSARACVDKRAAADRIVEIVKAQFPLAKLLVRSYDREHALQLVAAGVDVQIRETFELALKFGQVALQALGVPDDEAMPRPLNRMTSRPSAKPSVSRGSQWSKPPRKCGTKKSGTPDGLPHRR